jgi:ubiquinol-cytochrome c reductase cytochrome b subunit
MKAIVVDYPNHFRWLKNSSWYAAAKEQEAKGESVDYINPDDSEMADWTGGNTESLNAPENAENVTALVEFLFAEAARPGASVDAALVSKGKELATEGSWAGALNGTSCSSCHDTIGQPFPAVVDEASGNGYPTMAGYGSAAWLKDFIRHPDAMRHYGSKNRMPAYGPEQLTDNDLELLVRWMTGDYPASSVADYPSMLDRIPEAK